MPRSKKTAEPSETTGRKSSPKPLDRVSEKVNEKVATAFTEAQRTAASHARASKLLQNAYAAAPIPFVSAFTHALNRILLVFSRDANIERLVLFVAKFASQAHDTGNFCSLVLMYLLSHTNATGRAIRFRTVQLVASVLHHLPEDTELADEVWAPLREAAFDRSFDKVPRVRAAAAGTLCRLQTGEPDDPFGGRLVEMLTSDSSSAVRKAAIQSVAITEHTIEAVAGRTRDVNVDVRKAAYEMLAGKVNPFELHTSERVALLVRGLGDRDAAVREVVESKLLLDGWFDGACEGNVFSLIELLGCEEYEEDVLRALGLVFASKRREELVEAVEIDVNNLTHADVLTLRAVSDAKKGDEAIEKYLPSALLYAEVLRYYSVNDFASRHLLELCRSVDVADEAGRKFVEDVIRADFLASPNISEATVRSGVRAMRRVVMDEESTSRLMLDIVREVLFSDNERETEENTQSEDEIHWREMRALNICVEVLRMARQGATSGSAVNSICLSIVEAAVLPQLMCEDEQKRRTAMECLGLFCLMDKSGAEAGTKMPLFVQAAKTDVLSIQKLALQILVDFMMVFDFAEQAPVTSKSPKTPKTPKSGGRRSSVFRGRVSKGSEEKEAERRISFSSAAEECISVLAQNIANADSELRTIAVEGLARLFFVRRVAPNPSLLSRLLIVYHNPTTENDDKLRQSLSVFFPSFAFSSAKNRLALEDAFRPTFRVISAAPSRSSLRKVSFVQVAQLVLHLTNPANVPKRKERTDGEVSGRPTNLIHERLAEVVLNEIIDAFQGDEISQCRELGKILSNFRFSWSPGNSSQLERLVKLAKAATNETEDRKLKAVLQKFLERIQQLLDDNEEELAKLQEDSTEPAEDQTESEKPHSAISEKEPLIQTEQTLSSTSPDGEESSVVDKKVEADDNETSGELSEDQESESDENKDFDGDKRSAYEEKTEEEEAGDDETSVELPEDEESESDENRDFSNVESLENEAMTTKYPRRARRRVRYSETVDSD